MPRKLAYTDTAAEYVAPAGESFVPGDTLKTRHDALWYVYALAPERELAWCRNERTGDFQTLPYRLLGRMTVVSHET